MSDHKPGETVQPFVPSDVTLAFERLRLRLFPAGAFNEQIVLKTPDMELALRGAVTEWYRNHLLVWTEHYGEFLVHRDEVSEFQTKQLETFP